MADTVRDLIEAAYVDSGRLAEGETLDDVSAEVGLRRVQDLYLSLANGGAFGRVRARLVTADYTAEEGDRIGYDGATSSTITLPTTVEDATSPAPYGEEQVSSTSSAVDTTNRAPRDHSMVQVAGTSQLIEVYDALLGDWVQITSLTLTTDAPLCNRWRGELVDMLVPRVALAITPEMKAAAGRAKSRLVINVSAPRQETVGVYF